MGNRFDLEHTLLWGTLPGIFNLNTTEEKSHYLRAYALTYLKEEIIADWQFSYLKTKDNAGIDLIIDHPGMQEVLVEIKSTCTVSERDVATLNRFMKDMTSVPF